MIGRVSAGVIGVWVAVGVGDPYPVHAQDRAAAPRLQIEALGYASLVTGDKLEVYAAGFGAELFGGVKAGGASILVGGGARRYGRYDSNDHSYVIGVGIQPRYTFSQPRAGLEPWVGLKLLKLYQTHRLARDARLTSAGVEAGFGVGLGIPRGKHVLLNTSVYFSYLGFGDISINEVFVPRSALAGGVMNIGLGITYLR